MIGQKVRVCIIAAKYNEKFTDALVENAIAELSEVTPMARIDLIRVPGAFEIPVTAATVLEREKFVCIIALGLILRGDTTHADLVASSVTTALQNLAVQFKVPIINEVLQVEDEKQAHSRCIGASQNRGREAARAAAGIMNVFSEINRSMPKVVNSKSK